MLHARTCPLVTGLAAESIQGAKNRALPLLAVRFPPWSAGAKRSADTALDASSFRRCGSCRTDSLTFLGGRLRERRDKFVKICTLTPFSDPISWQPFRLFRWLSHSPYRSGRRLSRLEWRIQQEFCRIRQNKVAQWRGSSQIVIAKRSLTPVKTGRLLSLTKSTMNS